MTDSVGFVMQELGARPLPRNAKGVSSEPFYQGRLKAHVDALVAAFGWRDDYQAPNKRRVPYLPPHFAAEILDYFRAQARSWLSRSVPGEAKQPRFIRNRVREADEILGANRDGRVAEPNPASYEAAPPSVAAKAPKMFAAERPAGQPHAKVLTGPATHAFLHAMGALAMHLDALSGQPSKLDLFAEAVRESAEELPARVKRAVGGGTNALKTAALVAAGAVGAALLMGRRR